MSVTRKCEACDGRGYIVVAAGLAALEDKYPELPIREMEHRGWLGDVGNGEDAQRCDAAFLDFWGVATHADVRAKFGPHNPETPAVTKPRRHRMPPPSLTLE